MAHPRPFFPWFFHPLRTHLPLSQLHVALPFHRYVSLGIDFKRFTLFPTIVVKNWTLIANNLLRYASIHDTVAGGLTELVCVCVCVCMITERRGWASNDCWSSTLLTWAESWTGGTDLEGDRTCSYKIPSTLLHWSSLVCMIPLLFIMM